MIQDYGGREMAFVAIVDVCGRAAGHIEALCLARANGAREGSIPPGPETLQAMATGTARPVPVSLCGKQIRLCTL